MDIEEFEMTAQDTYIEAQRKTQAQLQEIQRLLEKHRDTSYKSMVHWGHVGDLSEVYDKLDEIIRFLK